MAIEIERKFLVTGDGWRRNVMRSEMLRQGYLSPSRLVPGSTPGTCSVRVRLQGDRAFLNIKEAVMGRERLEFDYGIPVEDAVDMLESLAAGPVLEKTRHVVEANGLTWEIDVFHGANAGLVVAEIELEAVDAKISAPDWLGKEVTELKRYYNVALVDHPYSQWTEEERRT